MNTKTEPEILTVEAPDTSRPRLRLSITQVIASGLAAITATLTASYLGLSGTVVGAALASVITVSGSAVYAHSINRTRQRVLPATRTSEPVAPAPVTAGPGLRWFGLAGVGLFMTVLGVIAGAQLVTGRPVSQVLRDGPSSTVTVTTRPTQTVSEVVVPTTVTVTSTATASVTSTPTPTPTASTTAPTPTPTPTPTVDNASGSEAQTTP